MKLEIGKRYVRRDGEVTGLLQPWSDPKYPYLDPTTALIYMVNGLNKRYVRRDGDCDLVSEYVDHTKPPINKSPYTKDEEIIQQGGMKFETGAVRSSDKAGVMYHLITPIGIRRLAETYKEGFDKYGAYNWERGFPIGDVLNHAIAHIFAYLYGESTNEDDLAHAAWNLLAAMHMEETHPNLDHQLRPNHPITKRYLEQCQKQLNHDL